MIDDTGIDYQAATGKRYPIVHENGLFYIYDPRRELQKERAGVLEHLRRHRRTGLGYVPQGAFTAAATAANFIPVVGPALSAVISAVGAIFGGGDPTALSVLINQIVQLRAQIAQLNNQLGLADPFTVPADFNAQDKDKWRDFVDGIVEQVLSTTEADIQGNRRPDYYQAIKVLQAGVDALTQQVHDAQIIAEVRAADGSSTPAAQAAANDNSSPNWILLAGLGALAWFVTTSSRR